MTIKIYHTEYCSSRWYDPCDCGMIELRSDFEDAVDELVINFDALNFVAEKELL